MKITSLQKYTAFGIILVLSVFFVFATQTVHVHAQQAALDQAQTDRAALEAQLSQLEADIAAKQKDLDAQKGQSQTLTNQIAILKTQIDKAKLNIQAKNLVITKLTGEIGDKTQTIDDLTTKIDKEKESLGQLIRKTNEIDNASFVHLALSDQTLSSFYDDVNTFASIKVSIKQSVDQIQGAKTQTEAEKQSLEDKQNQELAAKAELIQTQKEVEANQAQQAQLLALSKQKAAVIAQDLASKQQAAATLRARLFALAGGAQAIQFGDAVTYAEAASQATGVRPAFLLAILQQETGIGANQGACYLSVPETGAGIRVKTGEQLAKVMSLRDVPLFLQITQGLGLDPMKTRVSCPFASGGYGGAMGISQFIPSTWALLQSRISAAIGGGTPNPWSPKDAFTASALYLADLGANSQTYTDEWNAACRYYSGAKCKAGRVPPNVFYGNSVMALASQMDSDINYLKQYGVSRR